MSKTSISLIRKQLLLGETEFSNLRDKGQLYVDKTKLIYELAKDNNKILLTRPRKFGKSLLVSTLNSLFKHGLKDFSGLEIEKLWKDDGSYSVIQLDLSKVSNFKDAMDFENKLSSYLIGYMNENRQLNEKFQSSNGIQAFYDWLDLQPNSSVVLLIDNYDAPLMSCFNQTDISIRVGKILASLYSCLKASSGAFRFLFLTGITKAGNTPVPASLNNLEDVSLIPEFGEIVGFSKDELLECFGDYIKHSSDVLQIPEPKLIEELVNNYYGYCFDETASKKVFAPWSILNFFNRPSSGFKPYWIESGEAPTLLQELFGKDKSKLLSEFFQKKALRFSALSGNPSWPEEERKALLFQTGFLTIKGCQNSTLFLGFPNFEVTNWMTNLFLKMLLEDRNLKVVRAGNVLEILAKGDIDGFVKWVNNAFLALDSAHCIFKNPKSCKEALLLFLLGSGIRTTSKSYDDLDGGNIEFSIGDVQWMIELKYLTNPKDVTATMVEDQKQVKERQYGKHSFNGKLVRLVMMFSENEKRFVKFSVKVQDT